MVTVPRFGGTLAFLMSWLAPWHPIFRVRSAQSDLAFFVHRRDAIGRHIAKYGTHEPLLTKWLSDYLTAAQPGLFIDVGANLGWHALHAARHDSIETVVAFEPNPFNAQLLERNRSLNNITNLVIKASAAGAQCGVARLYCYKNSNLGRHSMVTDYGYESQIVPLVTLDQALVELGFVDRPVTALKIDVEGFEPAVIAGASQTLKRTNAVILEYSPELSSASGLSTKDMVARLCDAGLVPFALRSTGGASRVGIDELLAFKGQLDIIWIREECTAAEHAPTNAAVRGNLFELAEANKIVVKPI
jgi:FkbM family methyltransferase